MTQPDEDLTNLGRTLADATAITFHDVGRGPNNDEQDLRVESAMKMATASTLQHSPKFISLFDQLGYEPQARLTAIEVLMRISAALGPQCYANETKSMRAFLETTHAITFTMKKWKVHIRIIERPCILKHRLMKFISGGLL